MRRGLFVYCRQAQKRRLQDDDETADGSAGEAQQAPDGGVDDDGRNDLRGGDDGGDGREGCRFRRGDGEFIFVTNDAGDGLVVTHSAAKVQRRIDMGKLLR